MVISPSSLSPTQNFPFISFFFFGDLLLYLFSSYLCMVVPPSHFETPLTEAWEGGKKKRNEWIKIPIQAEKGNFLAVECTMCMQQNDVIWKWCHHVDGVTWFKVKFPSNHTVAHKLECLHTMLPLWWYHFYMKFQKLEFQKEIRNRLLNCNC